ncbi:MAG: polyprenol phosphomannose-dependent alpha 1,6 mannosyltransferase MptB [Propionibacteriaceae bacterium]|nr:polyprenol phosphomannose-dependent alpha 1,6 mannosyltransferase MptB [Propionibacteriaceae bacterium]
MGFKTRLTRAGSELARAWRLPPVRRGFCGTLAITVGSLTPAYLPQSSPLWQPLRAAHLDGPAVKLIGTVIVLAGLWCLVDGWFRLRRDEPGPATGWAILAIWSLPFLLAPPIFSHDAYSYAAQGWMLHNQVNPYQAGPSVLPGAFADQVAWVWRYTPAPYGPLSLRISHLLVDLSGFNPTVATWLMRLPALIGVGLIVTGLPRIARRIGADVTRVTWYACLNPLLVIDFVGGAHNDALMMGLAVLALSLSCHRRWWLPAAVLIGLAAAIKQPAFLAAYVLPLLTRPLSTWRDPRQVLITLGRSLLALGVAAAAFVAVSWACGLGFGWIDALGVPGSVVTVSPSTVIGQGLQWLFDPGGHDWVRLVRGAAQVVGFALVAVFAVWLAPRQPIRALSVSWLAVAFTAPALHSWYVLWGGLLLPLSPVGRRWVARVSVSITVVLLSYAAINLAWRNGVWAIGVAAGVLLLWWAYLHEREVRQRRAVGPSAPAPSPSSQPSPSSPQSPSPQ